MLGLRKDVLVSRAEEAQTLPLPCKLYPEAAVFNDMPKTLRQRVDAVRRQVNWTAMRDMPHFPGPLGVGEGQAVLSLGSLEDVSPVPATRAAEIVSPCFQPWRGQAPPPQASGRVPELPGRWPDISAQESQRSGVDVVHQTCQDWV